MKKLSGSKIRLFYKSLPLWDFNLSSPRIVLNVFASSPSGRPNNIEFSRVFTSLEQIKGVKKVHDLRIWALTMDKVAVSVHLEVAQPQNAQSVLRDTRTMLKRVYGVHESTIQIEGFIAEKDCGRCDVPK
ncbi:hypothetical protein GCK32_019780 [Trichostrongylus colubriformis]|uniref:Cation efflux protein cytoplasmic domain-containing protein n=1 Tax=Trichostrongylus colubriformis TaxID=6319 RepID=A0AAN8FJD4_TRICO